MSETIYRIRDADGRLVANHHRVDLSSGEKKIWWTRPNGEQGLNRTRLDELPLYGSELLHNCDPDDLIILVEGEKAQDALQRANLPSVGTVCGAGVTPGDEVLEVLYDRRVCLWPDNDEVGRAHMRKIAERLYGKAAEVLVHTWLGAPHKGDAADHPAVVARDRDGLYRLLTDLEGSPRFKPATPDLQKNGKPETITAVELLVKELAPVRWAVPGLMPEGVSILAGKPRLHALDIRTPNFWLSIDSAGKKESRRADSNR